MAEPGYKPPVPKSLQEIHDLDQDDESLIKYKQSLLGGADVCEDAHVGPNLVVTRLTLLCDTAPKQMTLDLQGDLKAFKHQAFVLKEGVEYQIQIGFKVKREIVSGLVYSHEMSREGVKVDRNQFMIGSYGPRLGQESEYTTPVETAPSGLKARGTYSILSKFIDDDKNVHLSWEWKITIKSEWSD